MNVAAHILSITILSCLAASFFFSTTYVFIFIFKPFNREASDEQTALLGASKVSADPASKLQEKNSQETDQSYSSYLQMAAFALLYSVIQAGWFNSNKVLMQLSWKSDDDSQTDEVFLNTFQKTELIYV